MNTDKKISYFILNLQKLEKSVHLGRLFGLKPINWNTQRSEIR